MDKKSKGMDEVVGSLADLLIRAAPLAKLLNSPTTAAEHRARLREAVGSERYFELATALNQMASWRAWEIAHAKDAATRQKFTQVGLSGVSFENGKITFHRHGESS
ncbi:hypothetical protein LWC34_43140 [Kibdelosporangium philippinense]|uniref:Uncharacterized protein n=1 Tax=Kibdelosporangium philippinense TaxID=211113 RepID=A0ABS8ZP71_9PSEU|nr:hypothetical protein [Kibdelosporangium philippinense]MCE7009559.1 hypothetical protein [Kibdelosporangium philippinense]